MADIGVRAAGRVRRRERRRAAVSRPSDALGGWRPGYSQLCCLREPNEAFRNKMVEPAREFYCARRSAWSVDRQSALAARAEDHHTRHGFERKPAPGLRRARARMGHLHVKPHRRIRGELAVARARARYTLVFDAARPQP